ncbi:MAG: filamentous hemagglutinin N-terminal domain-containing protein [Phormidesmis sp.]
MKIARVFWLSITTSLGLLLSTARPLLAQIVPDSTLGSESSLVIPTLREQSEASSVIEGGALRGENLFHSFSDFNIAERQTIYFANPAFVEHIFSRVTGENTSSILGQLGVDGSANLYLLNPNGVFFGSQAILDIEGSLFVGAAGSIGFADGSEFSAAAANDGAVLTVSTPLGLQTGQAASGASIVNVGNLQMQAGESLSLFADVVQNAGSIYIPGGEVYLLGNQVNLLNSSDIDVSSASGGGQVFVGKDSESGFAADSVRIDENAVIEASANDIGQGGQVVVWSAKDTSFAGVILARGGEQQGDGGFVEVSGENGLRYAGQVDAGATNGIAGTLLIDPTNIEIVGNGADTFDLGDVDQAGDPDFAAGTTRIAASVISSSVNNVVLEATQDITFNTDVDMTAFGVGLTATAGNDVVLNGRIQALGKGDITLEAGRNLSLDGTGSFVWSYGGDIRLVAGNVIALTNGAQADTAPFFGNSGNLTVTARQLTLTDGSQLKVAPFDISQGGTLTLNVDERVLLSGIGVDPFGSLNSTGLVASNPLLENSARSGEIKISTRELSIQDGASIGAQTSGFMSGGAVTIRDAALVEIIGFSPASSDGVEFVSGIFSSPDVSGLAGTLDIETDRLVVTDGGLISSNAGITGAAGGIVIDADSILLTGGSAAGSASGVTARALGLAAPGSIDIQNAQTVTITDGAMLDVSVSLPLGLAQIGSIAIDTENLELSDRATVIINHGGTLAIDASNAVVIDAANIIADGVLGGAGLVSIETGNLAIVDRGQISTSTFSEEQSGNVQIQVDNLFELNNGFVSAASALGIGRGGNVTITARELSLENGSVIDTAAIAQGSAGTLNINVGELILRDRSSVSVSGLQSQSRTGDLIIRANTAQLESNSKLEAVAPASDGGNISLSLNNLLLLRGGSSISAEAGTDEVSSFLTPASGLGNGGNVTIRTPFIVAIPGENSDISANARLGNGGRVNITAQGIFGTKFREQRTPQNDITASSEFGLSGIVAINAPDTGFLEDSLNDLPDNLINADQLVATSCIARQFPTGSLAINNSQGLPEQPTATETVNFPTGTIHALFEESAWQHNQPIGEPEALYRLADGRLIMSRACE